MIFEDIMWRVGDRVYPVWPDGADMGDVAEVVSVSDDGWSRVRWLSDTFEALVSPTGKTQYGAELRPLSPLLCKSTHTVLR